MNELLLLGEIIFVFSSLLLVHKFLGKTGIFIWMGLMGVLVQLFVVKQVSFFGVQATMANVEFASLFLATDILSEYYGEKEAKKAPYYMLFFIVFYMILTQLVLLFVPNELDYVQESMVTLLGQTPRIAIASIFMMFVANRFNVVLFNKLSKLFKGKHLWIRNNISTIVCNGGENFLFTFLAFYHNPIVPMGLREVIIVSISSSIIETIIALCDTPFVYIAKMLRNEKGTA